VHQIPHYAPPTHLMQMLRYAENGTLRFLCGTFTNADRTVHLSEKAVDPPGEARPDLDILLDYARRMDFRDKSGNPFPAWHDAETAFEAWKQASVGRVRATTPASPTSGCAGAACSGRATDWDPASKQPLFKTAAATIRRGRRGGGGVRRPAQGTRRGGAAVKLGLALRELHRAEKALARDLLQVSDRHAAEHEMALTQRCHLRTLRQLTWTNAMPKTLSPQVLAS